MAISRRDDAVSLTSTDHTLRSKTGNSRCRWATLALVIWAVAFGSSHSGAQDAGLSLLSQSSELSQPAQSDAEVQRSAVDGRLISFEEVLPAPAEFSLEDRLRQLEQQFATQQAETELLRNRLAEISSSKDAKPDPKSFKASWKNQLTFESADKNFTAHFGGRTQFDTVWMGSNPVAYGVGNGSGASDAVDVRRARFRMEGTIFKTTEYTMEYDFVNTVNDNGGLAGGLPSQPASASNIINVPAPTDLYWTFREIPWIGNFRVGNQKEPIGFEHLTSSRYLDFMERSFNQDAYTGPFNNGFTPGVSIFNNFGEEQNGFWQVGVFKNVVNVFTYGVGDGAYAFDGRMAYLLWNEDEGRRLLHVGGAVSHRDMIGDAIRIRSRGSLRNGPGSLDPVYADTGTFLGDSQQMAAAEMALVLGSFQLQSEYVSSAVLNARNAAGTTSYGTYMTNGYYVMASYFLTGEHREYEKKNAAFGRVVPHQNSRLFPQDCTEPTWGAWQVLARYSALDLNDKNLNGGQIWDMTLGINWFLNPNMKIQANYVYMDRNSLNSPTSPGSGPIQGFGMRLAHDF